MVRVVKCLSKYTTEVRFICEQYAGLKESVGFSGVNEVIDAAVPKVFDFEFPIFDESYRGSLCRKILKHYYTREICEETVGLWKLRLDMRMNEIMPYYNQLYNSELIKFDPLHDTELTTTGDRDGSNAHDKTVDDVANTKTSTNTDSTNDSNSVDWDMYSETPQGGLSGVENGEYLTTARKTTNESNTSGNVTGDSETDYTDNLKEKLQGSFEEKFVNRVTGKTGGKSFSQMLSEFRKTMLNIDMMVIDELSDLFFTLW